MKPISKKAKAALRAVITAKVALWDAERGYELEIGREINSFEPVSDFAVCAEDMSDEDLQTLAERLLST